MIGNIPSVIRNIFSIEVTDHLHRHEYGLYFVDRRGLALNYETTLFPSRKLTLNSNSTDFFVSLMMRYKSMNVPNVLFQNFAYVFVPCVTYPWNSAVVVI